MKEIFELQDERARLLGYDNSAELELQDSMPGSVAPVKEFLTDLRSRLTPPAQRDLDDLIALKKRDYEERGLPFDGNFYIYDDAYYWRILSNTKYQVDSKEVSQYFSVDESFDRMLKIYETIFGFVFTELKAEDRAKLSASGNGDDLIWHSDVHVYTVFDEESLGGEFRGYLYRDLHPRQLKFGHNASFMLGPYYIRPDGSKRYIDSALVCNFSRPTGDKPGLLTHFEVWNMFHELGHSIHDLAAKTRYAKYCGASTGDFNEAPSQMLENWAWEPSVIRMLSKKWDTGEPMPLDLAERLANMRYTHAALGNLRQVMLGLWELTCHTPESPEAAKELVPWRLWNKLEEEVALMKTPAGELGL